MSVMSQQGKLALLGCQRTFGFDWSHIVPPDHFVILVFGDDGAKVFENALLILLDVEAIAINAQLEISFQSTYLLVVLLDWLQWFPELLLDGVHRHLLLFLGGMPRTFVGLWSLLNFVALLGPPHWVDYARQIVIQYLCVELFKVVTLPWLP